MNVQLSWRDEGGNRAAMKVSDMPGFFEAEPVKFGKESENANVGPVKFQKPPITIFTSLPIPPLVTIFG